MSKARQKGTAWETELLPRLRALWGPLVERAPLRGIADDGDFTNTPFLVEAKNTQKPLLQAWCRIAERKRPNGDWCVIWKGDRRVKTGNGPYVFMPLELFEQLVEAADMQTFAEVERKFSMYTEWED